MEQKITFATLLRILSLFNRGFDKHAALAIMPILISEVLLRENKKNPVTKCYPSEDRTWASHEPLIPSPTLHSGLICHMLVRLRLKALYMVMLY